MRSAMMPWPVYRQRSPSQPVITRSLAGDHSLWRTASVAFAASCIALLPARRASADEGAPAIHLRYSAPSVCPDETTFVARLRERVPGVRAARVDEPAPIVDVAIEVEAGAVRGRLQATDVDGQTSSREVSDVDCATVVQAMALIAAVAMDPSAERGVQAPAPRAPSAPSTRPRRSTAPQERATPARPAAAKLPLQVSVGPQFAIAWGAAPRPLLGVRLFGEVALPGDRWLRPSLRAAVTRTLETSAETGGAWARFRLTDGRVDACLGGWQHGVRVSPCALVSAGILEVSGERVPDRRTHTAPWLTVGALMRVQAVLAEPLMVELEGGLDVRLTSYRYYLEPDRTLFELPRVGGALALGTGLRFW